MFTNITIASLIAILTDFHIIDELTEVAHYVLDCGVNYKDIAKLDYWGIPHTCAGLEPIVENLNGKALITGIKIYGYGAHISYVNSNGVEQAEIKGENEQVKELLVGFLRNWTTYTSQLRHYAYELEEKASSTKA